MNIDNLKNYKILETSILNDTDKKHIENYKQLIKFFENAIDTSIKEGVTNYNSLHNANIQCIRYLDKLIYSYDASLQRTKYLNQVIDTIINDNKEDLELGNAKEQEKNLKSKEKLEQDR